MATINFITVRGASEHNLRHVDVTIPRDSLTVITGLSGSGKSSLAFDTIYAEGQRRYVESLSSYARQFLEQLHKPKVELIDGLSPAISIEQKTVSRNPRSTVGTVTEIYDFLRVMYANIGHPHCPRCDQPVEKQSVQKIVDTILSWPAGTRFHVMAPIVRGRKGTYQKEFDDALRQGFVRARVDGEIVELDNPPKLLKSHKHDISIVIDRLTANENLRGRLLDSVELALQKADGLVEVETPADGVVRLFSQKFACPSCGISIEERRCVAQMDRGHRTARRSLGLPRQRRTPAAGSHGEEAQVQPRHALQQTSRRRPKAGHPRQRRGEIFHEAKNKKRK
jgi:excinuclease ABC subunit A